MAIESDGPKTSDIIEYLQEHGLWDDPEGDMDPKELRDFCESLMLTQEVGFADIYEWLALRNAQDITDKVEETVNEVSQVDLETSQLSSPKSMQDELIEEIVEKKSYEYLADKVSYDRILKFVNTTANNFIQDISLELDGHDPKFLRSVRIAIPMYIGPKTMSRFIETLMEKFGNSVMFEVIPKPTNQFTDIYIRPNGNLEAITNLDIYVSIELD